MTETLVAPAGNPDVLLPLQASAHAPISLETVNATGVSVTASMMNIGAQTMMLALQFSLPPDTPSEVCEAIRSSAEPPEPWLNTFLTRHMTPAQNERHVLSSHAPLLWNPTLSTE